MPSTTADQAAIAARLRRGLQNLTRVVTHVRLPETVEDEQCCVDTLLHLQARRPIPPTANPALEELTLNMGEIDLESGAELWRWSGDPDHDRGRNRFARTRHRRVRVLLLLLADVLAPRTRFALLPALERKECGGFVDDVRTRLDWIPSNPPDSTATELCWSYLRAVTLCTRVPACSLPTRDVGTSFDGAAWQVRLAHLVAWRDEWQRRSDENPTMVADRPEFDLARDRAFTRLRRQGGRVARRALEDLGYEDPGPRYRFRWRSVWGPALLALALAATQYWMHVRLNQIAQSDLSMAAEANELVIHYESTGVEADD